MVRSYTAADLVALAAAVERLASAGGVPVGSLSAFATGIPRCAIHAETIRFSLRLREGVTIGVSHCGCDCWFEPLEPPPGDLDAMARDLAEEVVWCWSRADETVEMVHAVGRALVRETERGRSEGLEWRPRRVELDDFETFCGRRHSVNAWFDIMGDGLRPMTWWRPFSGDADVRRFFRSTREYQRALAARRDHLADLGAQGAVDEVALAAMREAGVDADEHVARLAGGTSNLLVDLGGRQLVLAWRLGIVEGRLDLAPGVRWEFGRLRVEGGMDAFGGRRCTGEPITALVSSPLLPSDALVYSTCRTSADTTFLIDPRTRLFDMVDGRVRWLGTETRRHVVPVDGDATGPG